jgi:hypothetical protein
MKENPYSPLQEDYISFKDIVDFFVDSWKGIVLTGSLGIFGSITYLLVTPNQYQATAQIQMAQISSNNTNPLGVNIEDPNLLIARLQLPTTYSDQEIKACGFEDKKFPLNYLANAAKFSAVKGVGSLIELKINSNSKEVAISCAQSLFESIKTSQNDIIKPFIEEAKTSLIKYQGMLSNSQTLVSRADKSGVVLSAAYLASRDEIRFLSEEILRLNNFIISADTRQARLVAPIYASDIPVSPRKKIALISGLFVGLFLGLLMAICKRAFVYYKTANPKC